MNMKTIKPILAISLFALVLFAGCILSDGPTQITTSPMGMEITEFYPVADEVYAGGSINLYVAVQNKGYFSAKDINLTLYNCGCMNTGSSGAGPYTCNGQIELSDELQPPDAELQVPGEATEDQIALETSTCTFPEGRSGHTFSARIEYDYQSTATRDVVFTTFDNYRAKGGELETGLLNYGSNSGPVALTINAPSDPIIITDSDPTPSFVVSAGIRNLGNGFINHNETLDKDLDYVELCYPYNFVEPVFTEGTESVCDFNSTTDTGECISASKVRMIGIKNQHQDMDCKFKLLTGSVGVQDTGTFSSTIKYRYAQDKTASVVIVG